MVLMSDVEIPSRVIQQQLASAVRMVLQVSRLQDGSRRIVNISEVRGIADGRVDVHDVFHFERTGLTDAGKVQGYFKGAGAPPRVAERLKAFGAELPASLYNEVVNVNL
jgi:pilus assembly protein CpaF